MRRLYAYQDLSVLSGARYVKHLQLRETDLNRRPEGYEPTVLPDCTIPHV